MLIKKISISRNFILFNNSIKHFCFNNKNNFDNDNNNNYNDKILQNILIKENKKIQNIILEGKEDFKKYLEGLKDNQINVDLNNNRLITLERISDDYKLNIIFTAKKTIGNYF
jgi:hypothetical protein